MKVSDIKQDLLSRNLAKILKTKNFDWLEKGHFFVDPEGKLKFTVRPSGFKYDENVDDTYLPSIDFVNKWLREVHHIFIEINSKQKQFRSKTRIYNYTVYKRTTILKLNKEPHLSYKECLEAAIEQVIEII